jgi:outer membrane protein assembly factor BamB
LFVFVFAFTSLAMADDSSRSGDWPQWRGPQRDGHSTDKGLLKTWPKQGPSVLWQVDTVGVGYSSVAVNNGRIYTQGDLNGIEHVLCLDAKTGAVIWAVEPGPVAAKRAARVAEEMERLDSNRDGRVDELEAISRLGFEFNKFDKRVEGDLQVLAATRTDAIFSALDSNQDKRLTDDEAGRAFFSEWAKIDRQDDSLDAGQLATERVSDALKRFDNNQDGAIDRRESRDNILGQYFRRADQREAGARNGDSILTREELTTYFVRRETGKDGVIERDELLRYFVDNYPGGDGVLTAEELQGFYGGYRNGQGDGPRGTPTIDGDRLYTEGGNGDITCLDAATGRTNWHVNLIDDFGGGRPNWGYSESPLVVGEMLIVTPGGKQGTVAALDKYTGQTLWQSESVTEAAHYSSPVIASIHGTPTIVQYAKESVFGITVDQGQLLWTYNGANNGTANCSTPIVDDNHVFVASSYRTGGGLAEIVKSDEGQTAEEVYFEKKMTNHHGGIVKVGDHLYGFGNSSLICMDFKTGEIAWQDRSVGKGSLTVADGMLYLLSENHEVALAEATSQEYREHGRFEIPNHGRKSWAHPVVTGGVLYIRDQQWLTAYEVRR